MKKKRFLFVAMLFAALSFGFVSCENPDDDKFGNSTEQSDDNDTPDPDEGEDNSSDNEQNGEETPEPEAPTSGTENGYDYVDLGLSVNWATCNVGATKPEEYGNYYAWGEVEPKEVYTWSTYKFMDSNINDWNGVTKYTFADGQTSGVWYDGEGNFIGDNKTVLDKEDDAASVNMGGSWRMPTYDELNELKTKCTWTWTTLNGVSCYNVEGPNGNSIFLPAAGYRDYSGLYDAGSDGYYWSSSLNTGNSSRAYYLYFGSVNVYWNFDYRYCGHSVRGVFSH